MGHCRRLYCRRVFVWWIYSNFKKYHSNLGTHYRQHDTCNLNRVRNGCAMVAKPGTIVLIMKIAYKVEPLPSCCCMIFLTSNDLEGNISAKPTSLTVGYSRTRTRIYKSTAYRRERASGKWQEVRRPPGLQISSCSTTYKCRGERKIQLSIYFILKCPQLEHKPNSLFQSNQDPPFSYERWLIIWEKNVVSILVNIFLKYLLVLIRLSWHNSRNV